MELLETYQIGLPASKKRSVLYQIAFNSHSPTGRFRDSEGFRALKAESFAVQKKRALEMSPSKLALIKMLEK